MPSGSAPASSRLRRRPTTLARQIAATALESAGRCTTSRRAPSRLATRSSSRISTSSGPRHEKSGGACSLPRSSSTALARAAAGRTAAAAGGRRSRRSSRTRAEASGRRRSSSHGRSARRRAAPRSAPLWACARRTRRARPLCALCVCTASLHRFAAVNRCADLVGKAVTAFLACRAEAAEATKRGLPIASATTTALSAQISGRYCRWAVLQFGAEDRAVALMLRSRCNSCAPELGRVVTPDTDGGSETERKRA
mmetsp:Transcript_40305/g.130904  ORF Transcript_40305/g.130904 Transcript_40305/m.130904 type:complete len:254 (+) Transcript_40305:479-1240(+)